MSLDVCLNIDLPVGVEHTGIFIRENGQVREITRAEWDEKFPGREPVVVAPPEQDTCVYTANITHNLSRMANEAGIYDAVWRPDENNIEIADQLILVLEAGLQKLHDNPRHFKKFNPENGWGDYDGLCVFVERYLKACRQYPMAMVSVSR